MNLCVFAGSSNGKDSKYVEAGRVMGAELATRGIGVVYGGASIGVMGAVADGALAEGGAVIGVIPQSIADVEIAHEGLTDLRIVGSMHERKAMMNELSEGFILLPGGIGSLEEAFEVWTWAQLGIHRKPIGLLNVEGFYDGLGGFLDQLVEEKFVKAEHRQIMLTATEPAELVDNILAYELPAATKKWILP